MDAETPWPHADFTRHWKDIAAGLLKLGATAYGGPAIMGIMQAELQVLLLAATVIALLCWRVGAVKLMLAGSVLGVLRSRWSSSLNAVRSALAVSLGAR